MGDSAERNDNWTVTLPLPTGWQLGLSIMQAGLTEDTDLRGSQLPSPNARGFAQCHQQRAVSDYSKPFGHTAVKGACALLYYELSFMYLLHSSNIWCLRNTQRFGGVSAGHLTLISMLKKKKKNPLPKKTCTIGICEWKHTYHSQPEIITVIASCCPYFIQTVGQARVREVFKRTWAELLSFASQKLLSFTFAF